MGVGRGDSKTAEVRIRANAHILRAQHPRDFRHDCHVAPSRVVLLDFLLAIL